MLLASVGGLPFASELRPAVAAELPTSLMRFSESVNLKAAARLGEDYLALRPNEANVETLLQALFNGSSSEREDTGDLQALLSGKATEDFAAGRVVNLNDWQVSQTEARIFAAIALTA
jgi:hypothetical protein